MRTRTERLFSTDVLLLLLGNRRPHIVLGSLDLDPMQIGSLIAEASWNVSYLLLRDHLAARHYSFRRARAYRLLTSPAVVVLDGRFESHGAGARLVYAECAGRRAIAAKLDQDVLIVVGANVLTLDGSVGEEGLLAVSSFSLGAKGVEVRATT